MGQTIWKPLLLMLIIFILVNLFYNMISRQVSSNETEISYSRFREELVTDNVKKITIKGNSATGEFRKKATISGIIQGKEQPNLVLNFKTVFPTQSDPSLMPELTSKKIEITALSTESSRFSTILVYTLPWLLIIGVWWFALRGVKGQGPGAMLGSFAKSGAKMYSGEMKVKVSFDDVAGMENEKRELQEIVEFLKEPKKFEMVGGKVPKGVLLVGPPGTGKTLLAKAVAGEAGVPFFSISASQFIEMFVGVGAGRVRDLFMNGKKAAPSIIFIDEIDAVGRSRGAGFGGGHDEREQTLNQLLSEMDGFDAHEEVIVIAATNRPDVLDPALLRPGRFDRHVVIERPDWRDREKILRVHTRKISLDKNIDLTAIAKGTPGMTGADLESLINEAAIFAARDNAIIVNMDHLEKAKDKILMGGERKLIISDDEKRITAYHEAGHALVARLLPGADPVHKITIIPHGRALGVTQQQPLDDRYHYPKVYLVNKLSVALGGRVAERLVFNDISTGAQSDLKVVNDLAEKMVCQWGMSNKIGAMTFSRGEEHPFLGRKLAEEKSFSEEMAWLIDQEIAAIIREAEEKATDLVSANRGKLDDLAAALLEEETIDGKRLDEILLVDLVATDSQ